MMSTHTERTMNKDEENLGEELYSLLAELLNRRMNRTVQDSIRGEYGTLHYLTYKKNKATPGELTKHLHVVPGRMTDILSSLEYKGLIERKKRAQDKRKTEVWITKKGRLEAQKKREAIRKEYAGMFKILGKDDINELLRLLRIVLAYDKEE